MGWTRAGNRIGVGMYRALHGHLAGPPGTKVMLLTTAGRRTGLPRATCVRYLDTAAGLLVWGTGSGARQDPDWFQNLRAAGRGTVQRGTQVAEMAARELLGVERDEVWEQVILVRAPGVARYAKKAGRTIPVAELTPVD